MNKSGVSLLCCVALLNGCALFKPDTVLVKVKLNASAEMLDKCEDKLPALQGIDGESVLSTMLDWKYIYKECMRKHNSLVDSVNEFNKEGE